MDSEYCNDCKTSTEVVYDHASGDTVCRECGLVLEARHIDETSEWRTFADDAGDNDPNRVGASSNPLLEDGRLETVIQKQKGAAGDDFPRWNGGGDLDRTRSALERAFQSIDDMGHQLGLTRTINDRAKQLFKNVEDQKGHYKVKNRDATLAACLFLACKYEETPRTLKEIKTATNGVSVKEIGRAKKHIQEKVPTSDQVPRHPKPNQKMSRLGSNLGFNYQAIKAAQEAVKNLEEFDIRRAPDSIVAAVIYMINELAEEKKPLQDISAVTQVSVNTVRESYKEILPYMSRIVPAWYMDKVKGHDP